MPLQWAMAARDRLLSYRCLPLLAALLLCACAHAPRNPMAEWVPSSNYNARQPVLIVLHHTEQQSVQQSLDTLRTRNSGGQVSAHYLVGKDGSLYQLVPDSQRAWHAGAGRWGTIADVNSASIGIELDNDGVSAFPPAQIATLLRLLEDLSSRLRIPRKAVIGHADLAPSRKVDPSRWFPWDQLAAAGFGAWPDPADGPAPAGFDARLGLQALGYPADEADPGAAVRAFHRHYRGSDTLGEVLDDEDARILHSLLRQQR
ncbi:MAG TPA: N-acetylmuramoyl-L-alanine amidase [Stenotrophomonas sp.]